MSESNRLPQWFDELRHHDAQRTPGFSAVMQMPVQRRPHSAVRSLLLLAAALVLLLMGGWIGAALAQRGSLEASLLREDLSADQRVLLLQRAGSMYVRAANAYAAAAAQDDSTAIEVASRVLLGAAQAVASNGLDGGITPQLAATLQAAQSKQDKPLIWF